MNDSKERWAVHRSARQAGNHSLRLRPASLGRCADPRSCLDPYSEVGGVHGELCGQVLAATQGCSQMREGGGESGGEAGRIGRGAKNRPWQGRVSGWPERKPLAELGNDKWSKRSKSYGNKWD